MSKIAKNLISGSLIGWVILRHLIPEKEIEFKSEKIKVLISDKYTDDILGIYNHNRILYNSIEVWYDDSKIPACKVTYRYPFRVKGIKCS